MKLWFLLSFLLVTFFGNTQQAEEVQKADSLYNAQKFFEASVWYLHLLYANTSASMNQQAIEGKLKCLKKDNHFIEAIDFIQNSKEENITDSFKAHLEYEELLCNYLAGNFKETIQLSSNLHNNMYDTIGGLITVLSYNELYKWKEADSMVQLLLLKVSSNDSVISHIFTNTPKLKNIKKGKLLANIFPGAGQLYAGKFWEGLANSALQFGSLWFTILSWQREYYFTAGLIGFNGFDSFRKGGKTRTEILVEQYNKKENIAFKQKNKDVLIKWYQKLIK